MGDRVATKLDILTVRKQENMKAEIVIIIISVFFSMGAVPFDWIHTETTVTNQNWTLIRLRLDFIIDLRLRV